VYVNGIILTVLFGSKYSCRRKLIFGNRWLKYDCSDTARQTSTDSGRPENERRRRRRWRLQLRRWRHDGGRVRMCVCVCVRVCARVWKFTQLCRFVSVERAPGRRINRFWSYETPQKKKNKKAFRITTE